MTGGYVDGYVLCIPKKNRAAYTKMAKEAGPYWMKHGALAYFECLGDDLKSMGGTMSFKQLAKPKPTEEVWFSFIIYKNKKHRDQVNAKVMKDTQEMYTEEDAKKMPFDMKRMAYGGFKAMVQY